MQLSAAIPNHPSAGTATCDMQSAAANHMIYNHFFSHSKRKYQQAIIQNQQESIILSLIDCHCKKQESIILSLIDCYCKKQESIISCSKEKCLSINESQSLSLKRVNASALMRVNQFFFVHRQQLGHETTSTTGCVRRLDCFTVFAS